MPRTVREQKWIHLASFLWYIWAMHGTESIKQLALELVEVPDIQSRAF